MGSMEMTEGHFPSAVFILQKQDEVKMNKAIFFVCIAENHPIISCRRFFKGGKILHLPGIFRFRWYLLLSPYSNDILNLTQAEIG